ncbi:mucus binding protein, partial [Lactococcus laudensis]|nr:mucus binding protein [Lactococcus laudensis]
MRKIIGKKNKVHYVEETTRFQMVKSHKGWLVIGASMFALGLGMLVTSRPVSADVAAASTSSIAVRAETTSASSSSAKNAETTGASSSSATNADSTSANNSSAVKTETTNANNSIAVRAETTSASSSSAKNAETTGASSSSATNADSTSANNSSAVKTETTNANNSSAVKTETPSASSSSATKADSTSASNSSAVKTETPSASSSSATQADSANATSTNEYSASASNLSKTGAASTSNSTEVKTNAKYENSVETVDNNKRGNRENTHSINQRRIVKRSAIVTTKFAQNYGRKVLSGSVTNTGFSVSDPDYPSGMWIDPDKSHYSYEWLQTQYYGHQIVLSTNRTGDGIVYVTELSRSNAVLKQYTLNKNTKVPSAVFDGTTYYNDTYSAMVESSRNPLAVKYVASKYDSGYYNNLSYIVPKLITQTTYYVDKDGKQITDSNGNPVVAYTQKGLVGQNYTTSNVNVINGYYATAPSNSNGVMSPYGEIGASYVKDFHNGIVVTYTQTGSDGTMSASIAQDGKVLKTWTNIKPSDPAIKYPIGSTTTAIKNPYIPQTSDVKYVYRKLGNWVVSNPDGSTKSIIYPNDPIDPTKIADSSVPDYPVIAFIPGYIPEDHMGAPLVPVDPDDRTKGYIPPTPSDIGKNTTITYTADQQTGSVSYVDDTTGKTLKTDSISGTTGSKSSYSTSGNIADYKKHGYELVTDGYPADLTFDNDDTTDQNFTVHLKHRLTPVNPTDPQTPGAPINPDEPDGPKWPTRTNYDKTVHETVRYVDQDGHVVAKQHTDSVNFTRTVVVDNVT